MVFDANTRDSTSLRVICDPRAWLLWTIVPAAPPQLVSKMRAELNGGLSNFEVAVP